MKHVLQTGDRAGLDDAIDLLRQIIKNTPLDEPDRAGRLSNLSVALGLRYTESGQQADIDDCLAAAREAIATARPDDKDATMYRANLFGAEQNRWQRTRDPAALDELIEAGRAAVAAAPPGYAKLTSLQSALGTCLNIRYGQTGHKADLDDAIEAMRGALVQMAHDNDWGVFQSQLGLWLQSRSRRTGSMPDLDEAIDHMRAGQTAVNERAAAAANLSGALRLRADRSGNPADLDEAIREARLAVDPATPGDPDRAISRCNLGAALQLRFERGGPLADVSEAIQVLTDAVASTDPGSPARPAILSVRGTARMARFEAIGDPADLDQAVSDCRAAVAAQGTPDHMSLGNLSKAQLRHYQQTGDLAELDEAVKTARDALTVTPPGHPDYASHLAAVSNLLRLRFWQSGSMPDLEEAVEKARAALATAPADPGTRSTCLEMLGGAFHARYWRTGNLADLDQAIDGLRDSVAATPVGWKKRLSIQANLGLVLRLRASRTGSLADLDEAVSALRGALAGMGPGDRLRPLYLSELGAAFLSRFDEAGRPDDVGQGIQCLSLAVAATAVGQPGRGSRLGNLSSAIQLRFRQTGNMADLDEAIQVARDALAVTPPDHPSHATMQAGLASKLLVRFERTGNRADLEESIKAGRAAVAVCPPGDPAIALYLNTLGDSLQAEPGAGRAEALACWQQAAQTEFAPARERINAAVSWGSAAAVEGQRELAEEGFSLAVGLLPVLAWRGLDRSSQERQLARQPGLASDAAACAISAGHPERAVELLEQGRTVLWSQQLQLRGELDDLRRSFPDLAGRLDAIRAAFDPAAGEDELAIAHSAGTAIRTDGGGVDERMRLARQWDEIVLQVREAPGFAHFLGIPPFAELARAAAEGPVLIVNVSRFRCDALAVTPAGVTVIPLPGLTAADATSRANQFLSALRDLSGDLIGPPGGRDPSDAVSEVLGWLADAVTGPVFAGLGLTSRQDGRTLPRVWWCPTGPLTVLPLHAAGHGSDDCVLDRVVSSYASTLRALADARVRPVQDSDPRMLLVTMPVTPYLAGGGPLLGVVDEILVVARRFQSATTHLTGRIATVTQVLGALGRARYAHFACHGNADPADPSGGGLYLYDRPLTIRQLSEKDLPAADLAVLSACQSATGSLRNLDEVITMAAATQLAGFRHVIATMWSISDTAAPRLAGDVYDALSDPATRSHDVTGTARALHAALHDLRTAGYPPVSWAPFIHIGP